MAWSGGRTLDGIPDRVRARADTSVITSVSDAMRGETMKATMDLIDKLRPMASGDRFECAARGLAVVGYNVPIKVMCVGLYPYEQDILPPIATSLAYSPSKCVGVTPSVQIMSQAMAIVAKELRNRNAKKSKVTNPTRNVDDMGLVSKFAMLLRCSYLCSVVGVAFINCVPVPVDNTAKRVRAASMFSEWLGRMIGIHDKYGFRMSLMAMGTFASDTVRNTFSSYKGTNTMVHYIGLPNPAAVSYLNIHKYPAMSPIQTEITKVEIAVSSALGLEDDMGSFIEYQWKTYPAEVLNQYMKVDTIGALTRALAGYTAEELLSPFMIMSSNLFGNLGSIPTGYTPGAIPDTDDVRSVGGTGHDGGGRGGVDPGGPLFAQSGGGGGYQTGGDKSFYVGKNSILAQMNDPTGKTKSQQVIVLENMTTKLENILESFRSREKTVTKMIEMLEAVMGRHSVDDDDLQDIINVVKERFPEELTQLEEATAVVAAMPALIEGDTGVIEGMLQPSAPLMRRYDGTTMRDGVYEQMMMDRNSGVAQVRNPPQSLGVFSGSDPSANMGMFSGSAAPRQPMSTAAPSTIGSSVLAEFVDAASAAVLAALENEGTDDMIDAVQKSLFQATTSNSSTTMLDVMTKAVAIYAKSSNGSMPSDESLKGMVMLMDPPTDDNLIEVGTMIKDLCSNSSDLVEFMDKTLID